MKNYKIMMVLLIFAYTTIIHAQQLIDGIAAVVGDEVVLVSDVNMLSTQYAVNNKIDVSNNQDLFDQIRKSMLNTLVEQKVMLLKAKDDTITVTEEEIDNYLNSQMEYMTNQAGGKDKLEEYYGTPFVQIKKKFRKDIETQLIIQRLKQIKSSTIKLSRLDIENFYNTYKDSLPKQQETVNISHILITPQPSDSSTSIAYQKINRIKELLDEGKTFEFLAKEYSEDPGSAARNGNLGWADRGSFVPEYEEAAFNLKKDEISDVVQSQFGFHIIQLLDRQGEKINTRHILIKLQPTDADKQRTAAKLNDLKRQLISGEKTFEELALAYSEDPNVQKDKGNLGEYVVTEFKIPQFASAIKNLSEGEISEPIDTEFGMHIIRLNKRNPSRKLELDKDWEKISNIALNYKQQNFLLVWINELKKEYPITLKVNF